MREMRIALAVATIAAALLASGPAAVAKHGKALKVAPRGTVVSRALNWRDVAIQPDGKIVTSGWTTKGRPRMVVARRLGNGRLDPSFASVPIPFATPASGNLVALQPDGRILVAGTVSSGASRFQPSDFGVARLLPDGQLDPSFGSGGVTRVDFGADDGPEAIALDPTGSILLAGASDPTSQFDPNGNARIVVTRLRADGSPDPSFGVAGKVTVDLGGFSIPGAVTALPGGGVAVAGSHGSGDFFAGENLVQLHLHADGGLDNSFGNGGVLEAPLVTPADIRASKIFQFGVSAVTFGPDGALIAAGPASFDRGRKHFNRTAVERFRPDGARDPGFGASGISMLGSRLMGQATKIVRAPDGSVVIAGGGLRDAQLQLTRLSSTGSLDRSFARRGTVRTRVLGFVAVVLGAALDSGGRIVVAGWSELQEEKPGLSILARYRPFGKLDRSFGPAPRRHHRRGHR